MAENKLQSAADSIFADADTNPGTAYELGRHDERERCARIAETHCCKGMCLHEDCRAVKKIAAAIRGVEK